MNHEDRLRALYGSFNARDIDAVLDALTPDVDWTNAWEGGRLHGRDEVREYWTRQWAAIDPVVEPRSITDLPDGRVVVEVEQTVRNMEGEVIARGTVRHLYALRDGLVSRMDVEDAR